MLDANSPGKYPGSGFNVENIFEYHTKSSYQELIKESVLTQISENIDEIVKKGVYNDMSLEELSDFIKDNYSDAQIPSNLKEFIHQVDEFKLDKAANEVEVEDIHIDEYANRINDYLDMIKDETLAIEFNKENNLTDEYDINDYKVKFKLERL